jgi:hypothetical protein
LVKSDKYSILRQKVKVELYEIIKGWKPKHQSFLAH